MLKNLIRKIKRGSRFNEYEKILWEITNEKCIECGGKYKFFSDWFVNGEKVDSEVEALQKATWKSPITGMDSNSNMCATDIFLPEDNITNERGYRCSGCGNYIPLWEKSRAMYKLGYKDDLSVAYDFREDRYERSKNRL